MPRAETATFRPTGIFCTLACAGLLASMLWTERADAEIQIPIRVEHRRVVIPVRINDSPPLNLLLDSGMPSDGVYLFRREFARYVDTARAAVVRVPGAGSGRATTALRIEDATLQLGDVTLTGQPVLISQSARTQRFRSDGVIGYSLFGRYAVEIDYDRKRILLHDTTGFAADSTWDSVPITLKRNVPFLEGVIHRDSRDRVPVSLYIDLGSAAALEVLTGPGYHFAMPEDAEVESLGVGLNGHIYGRRGRLPGLGLSDFRLDDIRVAFAPAAVRSRQQGADGILGNDCIRRFQVIFDYAHERLYMKPGDAFGEPFD